MNNITKHTKHTKTKIKELPKGLIKNSLTHKTFSSLISLIKETGRDIKAYLDEYDWLDPAALRKHFYHYYPEISSKQMIESAIKQAIKRLELSDYIKIIRDKHNKNSDEEVYRISLTKKGLLESIRCRVEQRRQKQKWDGKWRIIVFDVLEKRRQIRDLLRNRLKWLGFRELQKSVWIFPYDVGKEIKQILEVCHIDIIGDVRFLTVEKMNNDTDLRKDFGLG